MSCVDFLDPRARGTYVQIFLGESSIRQKVSRFLIKTKARMVFSSVCKEHYIGNEVKSLFNDSDGSA